MSCTSCSTNKGPGGCKSNGSCGTGGCSKLNVFDWLANMESPSGVKPFNLVEIRFKNGRKDFYSNETEGDLFQGDIVATEASPGHDIGVVSLSGELVRMQMKKKNIPTNHPEIKKVYRKAKQLNVTAKINGTIPTQVQLDINGSNMYMGYNRVTLKPQAEGNWSGKSLLAFCTTDTMQWQLTLLIDLSDGTQIQAPFLLTTPFLNSLQ
jgi:hypothetical protein